MKNIWKLHRLLIASVAILCFALTGCGDKIEYGVMQPLTETDSRAVELITIYENYSAGRDYRYTDYSADHIDRLATTYYKIKPYIYGLMNTNSGDNLIQYNVTEKDFAKIVEMFFVTDAPVEMSENDEKMEAVFNLYTSQAGLGVSHVELVPQGKTYYENGDIVYSFERKFSEEYYEKVDYTVVEAVAEEVPVALEQLFAPGDTIYKIKNVKGPKTRDYFDRELVEISSPQDLLDMSRDYAAHGENYRNKLYLLTDNIDMAGVTDFLPIGRNRGSAYGFCSVFDGQGYSIRNLSLDETVPMDLYNSHYIALFDTIGPDGTVKNLNVWNIDINVPADAKKEGYEEFKCAGFAVYISGQVDNCFVQGAINNPAGGGGGFVNTVEGYVGTLIQNCAADVNITGSWGMGGFMVNGSQQLNQKSEFFRLYNCHSGGSITAQRYPGMLYYYDVGEFGGFADKTYSGIYEKCSVNTPLHIKDKAKYYGAFIANTEGDPITKEPARFIDCKYNPQAVGDVDLIGMINWKYTRGNYGDAQFSPWQ